MMIFDVVPSSTIVCIWEFVRECIMKEFGSCLRHVWYRATFWTNPHRYDLNPTKVKPANQANQTAEVILLVPGEGCHISCFLPLAEQYYKAGIKNIYTIDFKRSDQGSVSTVSLVTYMEEITSDYLRRGYKNVEYCLVGHSLGAICGSKQIWREMQEMGNSRVSMMISIAGRLKYVPNRFSWFCEDEKPEIEKTYRAIEENPNKAQLYTIWGDQDQIVPKQSAHIQGESSKECTVEGYGHLGVVFAPVAHKQAVLWTKNWLQAI